MLLSIIYPLEWLCFAKLEFISLCGCTWLCRNLGTTCRQLTFLPRVAAEFAPAIQEVFRVNSSGSTWGIDPEGSRVERGCLSSALPLHSALIKGILCFSGWKPMVCFVFVACELKKMPLLAFKYRNVLRISFTWLLFLNSKIKEGLHTVV